MTVQDIILEIEKLAPTAYQESYDNAGLAVGKPGQQVKAVLICFDVTEDIVAEAIECEANLIISHHPVIFSGLKRLNGRTSTERIVEKALKHDIALYAAHTNLDSVLGGINSRFADLLGLQLQQILVPKKGELVKLVTFVPTAYADNVREALFAAKAGDIGNYSCCSYNTQGEGTFKANDNTNAFVGKKNKIHTEPEIRIETIVPRLHLSACLQALQQAHPYEEAAYDIYPLENTLNTVGLGVVGNLPEVVNVNVFLDQLKKTFNVQSLRYSKPHCTHISRVAVCGGSSSSFVNDAIRAKADIFITGDCKYHQFIDAKNAIILADIGHYESEYFAMHIFNEIISEKFPNFAVYISKKADNPVNYL